MSLDKKLSVRVSTQEYDQFANASRNVHGRKPQELLRELMVAVAEKRVKITPTPEQLESIKQSTELYNVTR